MKKYRISDKKFEDAKIPVYRTDESGTVEVIITSNGATFSCEPGDYLSGPELEEKENAKWKAMHQ